MENRLQFRGILPLTPRPVSGYNSPSLRTGRRRPGWGDPDENGDIEETVPAGEKTDPGGGNSPVPAVPSVGGTPLFVAKAKGATVTDADGNTFLDYVSSWGPMILGHAHPKIVSAIRSAA